MPLVPYNWEQLKSDFRLCTRLKGCKVFLMFQNGGHTEGYLSSYYPDIGRVVLRDTAVSTENHVIGELERFKRILVDEQDRIPIR